MARKKVWQSEEVETVVAAPKKKIPVLKKDSSGVIRPAKEITHEPRPPRPDPPIPHVAHIVEPERLKLPDIKNIPVNLVELPRAIFKLGGEELFQEQLGETDKQRIIVFCNLLKQGWKIKAVQETARNMFLFVLEK